LGRSFSTQSEVGHFFPGFPSVIVKSASLYLNTGFAQRNVNLVNILNLLLIKRIIVKMTANLVNILAKGKEMLQRLYLKIETGCDFRRNF